MPIRWKCVRNNGRTSFEVGKIYEEGEGRSLCDGNCTWQAAGCESAVEWLREHIQSEVEFEEVKAMYSVGDKVRIVSEWGPGCNQNHEGAMDHWLGQVMTIRTVEDYGYTMEEDQAEHDGCGWVWSDATIAGPAEELIVLRNGDVVTTRNGQRWIALFGYSTSNQDVLLGVADGGFLRIESYDSEWRHCNGGSEYDIMRTERSSVLGECAWGDNPVNTTVFERKKVVSMEEALRILEEKLGTKVIIKED